MTNGLGNVWHNPERWEKDQFKHILTQKLQDVFFQQYRAYLNDEANSNKCFLAKMCDKGVYNMSHYLLNVKSPQIRGIIAKYRLDVNNTLDSKYRSFRCKNISSNLCRFCNVRQSVKHILLECSFRNLEIKREVFFENYKKCTGDFIFLSEDAKLKELLNVKPKCKTEDKAKAIEENCNYIRSIYFVIDKEVNV